MTRPVPDEPLAALREEIRWAGAATQRLRRGVVALLGALILALLGVGMFNFVTGRLDRPDVVVHHPDGTYTVTFARALPPEALAILGGLELLVALLAAGLVAFAYRSVRQRQLHRRLSALGGEAAVQVLLPLRTAESADARKLATNLLRELNLPTELTPAGTPEGSGAEVSGG